MWSKYQAEMSLVPPVIDPGPGDAGNRPEASALEPRPKEKADSLWRLTGWSFVLLVLVIFAGALATAPLVVYDVIRKKVAPDDLTSDPTVLLLSAIASGAGFLVVGIWGVSRAAKKGRPLPVPFSGRMVKPILLGLVTGAVLYGANVLYTWVADNWFGAPASSWTKVVEGSWVSRIAFLLIGSTLAPVSEELFFRGYIFGLFKRANRTTAGVIISAGLFTVAHLSDVWAMPFIFVLGAATALLYHRTGSLAAAIACHAINNLLAIGFMILS